MGFVDLGELGAIGFKRDPLSHIYPMWENGWFDDDNGTIYSVIRTHANIDFLTHEIQEIRADIDAFEKRILMGEISMGNFL